MSPMSTTLQLRFVTIGKPNGISPPHQMLCATPPPPPTGGTVFSVICVQCEDKATSIVYHLELKT